jgi:hypothetical protein
MMEKGILDRQTSPPSITMDVDTVSIREYAYGQRIEPGGRRRLSLAGGR